MEDDRMTLVVIIGCAALGLLIMLVLYRSAGPVVLLTWVVVMGVVALVIAASIENEEEERTEERFTVREDVPLDETTCPVVEVHRTGRDIDKVVVDLNCYRRTRDGD